MKRTMKYRLRFLVCLFAAAVFCAAVDTGSSQTTPGPGEGASPAVLRIMLDSEKKKNEALELQAKRLQQDLLVEKAKTAKLLARVGAVPVAPPANLPVGRPAGRPAPALATDATITDNGTKVVIVPSASLLGAKFATADRSLVLCSATGGKSVELLLPGEPTGALKMIQADGKSSIMCAATDSFGRSKELELAMVHIKDGNLVWNEKGIPSSMRSGKGFSGMRDMLRLARLRVSDGAESLFVCQFVPVVALDLKLTGRSVSAVLPYSYAVCKPVMVLSADSNWTSQGRGAGGSETFKSSGGQSLSIRLKSATFRADAGSPVEGMAIEAALTGSMAPATVSNRLVLTERIAKRIFSEIQAKKKACKTYSPQTSEVLQGQTGAGDIDQAISAQISNLSSAISTCSSELGTSGSALALAQSRLSSAERRLPYKYVYTTSKTGIRRSTRTIDWAQEKSNPTSYTRRYFKTYRDCQAEVNRLKKDRTIVLFASLESSLKTCMTRLSALGKERGTLTGISGTSSVGIVIRAQGSKALLARGNLTVGVGGSSK